MAFLKNAWAWFASNVWWLLFFLIAIVIIIIVGTLPLIMGWSIWLMPLFVAIAVILLFILYIVVLGATWDGT